MVIVLVPVQKLVGQLVGQLQRLVGQLVGQRQQLVE
jgi:hypothetical protein